jgi:hypothetical protein
MKSWLFFLFPTFLFAAQPIVIGFVGGMVREGDAVHAEVQLAHRLQEEYRSGVEVRMFRNRQGGRAEAEVLRLLDLDHDGTLSAEEKKGARIAIYGHSWGASEAVTLARSLGALGIPVLLTVQVDSVRKPGEDDQVIPSNVARAINFYQSRGWLHGLSQIRAADPTRTEILGNVRLDYKGNPVDLAGYPWYARLFMRAHIEIESDPGVWGRVESLIRGMVGAR